MTQKQSDIFEKGWTKTLPMCATFVPKVGVIPNHKTHKWELQEFKLDPGFETLDISGFGGPYEWTAQVLLLKMIRFAITNDEKLVNGIVDALGIDPTKRSESQISDVVYFNKEVTTDMGNPSATQTQAALGNLIRMAMWTYPGWLEKIETQCPDRLYTFDGSLACVPKPSGPTNEEIIQQVMKKRTKPVATTGDDSGKKGDAVHD